MNIWILHHYADPPDGHWTGTFDLYKHLIALGHQVTVFSSSFSHYSRKEERLQPGENFQTGEYEGVKFIFVRSAPYQKNDWRRALGMATFAYRSYRIGMKNKVRPDVIVGSTPHPFCALAAYLLSRRKKVPFFMELHDLWLQYMLDTGALSPKHPVAMGLEWLDKLLYRHAAAIFTLWPRMNEYLKRYNLPQNKMIWMPLGIDFLNPKAITLNPIHNREWFTIVCTARLGPASNVADILEAANILNKKNNHKIKIVIVGGGPEEDNLKKYARDHDLKNVEFKGMVRKEEIPKYLEQADACISGLPDVANYREYGTIPTKVLDYMASHRPTLFLTTVHDSIVEKAGAGMVVPPGDAKILACAFEKLADMPLEERTKMADNGIAYLKESHDLRKLAQRLEAAFKEFP